MFLFTISGRNSYSVIIWSLSISHSAFQVIHCFIHPLFHSSSLVGGGGSCLYFCFRYFVAVGSSHALLLPHYSSPPHPVSLTTDYSCSHHCQILNLSFPFAPACTLSLHSKPRVFAFTSALSLFQFLLSVYLTYCSSFSVNCTVKILF